MINDLTIMRPAKELWSHHAWMNVQIPHAKGLQSFFYFFQGKVLSHKKVKQKLQIGHIHKP